MPRACLPVASHSIGSSHSVPKQHSLDSAHRVFQPLPCLSSIPDPCHPLPHPLPTLRACYSLSCILCLPPPTHPSHSCQDNNLTQTGSCIYTPGATGLGMADASRSVNQIPNAGEQAHGFLLRGVLVLVSPQMWTFNSSFSAVSCPRILPSFVDFKRKHSADLPAQNPFSRCGEKSPKSVTKDLSNLGPSYTTSLSPLLSLTFFAP